MSRINDLLDQGQSIWLDYIDRGMLHSGELETVGERRDPRRHVQSDDISAGYYVQ